MSQTIRLSIAHQLGRVEARRRIESGFAKLMRQVPGSLGAVEERWEGDRLSLSAVVLGQRIAGVLDVQETEVTMAIDLPGLLGLIAGRLQGHLRKAGQLLLTDRTHR